MGLFSIVKGEPET